ncbi:hypothetical protein [Psittacicella gerlachiana]|uniref:Uncharacterized protein n=1 Tax=Psittacicella gerlachiana TaxID=2028574 RepID=A0A3A1YBV0_9GAMM|nr:hypothetical protein [Psittacicella gerlachiana]RIY35612.1 hypothetical protein CKF59_03445 [Psittacicella gerlachiana]
MSLQLQPVGLELRFKLSQSYSLTEFIHGPNADIISQLTPYFSLGLSQTLALIGDNSTLVNQMVRACFDDASKLNPFIDENEQSFLDLAQFMTSHSPQDLEALYFKPLVALNNIHCLLGNIEWEEALRDLITMNNNSESLMIIGTHVDIAENVCILDDLQSRFNLFRKIYLKEYSKPLLKNFINVRCREQGLEISEQGLDYITSVYQSVHPSSLDLDQTAFNILTLCHDQQKNPSLISKQYLQAYPEVFKFYNLGDDLFTLYNQEKDNTEQTNSKLTAFTELYTRLKQKQALAGQEIRSRDKLLPYTAEFAEGFAQYFRQKYPNLRNYELDDDLKRHLRKDKELTLAQKITLERQEKVLSLLQQHIQQAADTSQFTDLVHAGIDQDMFFEGSEVEASLRTDLVNPLDKNLDTVTNLVQLDQQAVQEREKTQDHLASQAVVFNLEQEEILEQDSVELEELEEQESISIDDLYNEQQLDKLINEHIHEHLQVSRNANLLNKEKKAVATFSQAPVLIEELLWEAEEAKVEAVVSPLTNVHELNAPLSRLVRRRKSSKEQASVDFTQLLEFE